jgi:hypothetical protein
MILFAFDVSVCIFIGCESSSVHSILFGSIKIPFCADIAEKLRLKRKAFIQRIYSLLAEYARFRIQTLA